MRLKKLKRQSDLKTISIAMNLMVWVSGFHINKWLTYPELTSIKMNDHELIKVTTKDDTIRDLQYRNRKNLITNENHFEISLRWIDSGYYKENIKHNHLNKKKIYITYFRNIIQCFSWCKHSYWCYFKHQQEWLTAVGIPSSKLY